MTEPVLQALGLTKFFGERPVLIELSLTLYPGQAVAVVGRNGVGKSTLIRVFCGLSRPGAGRLVLFGHDASSLPPAEFRKLGVLLHQSLLYPTLTALENLEFYGELYGVSAPRVHARRWLERVGLAEVADEPARTFSRGMEQRLAIARAMLAAPDLLLMDEPFAALDAEGTTLVAELVREALERGCCVVLTAHATLEIEGVQFEFLQLERGRLNRFKEESKRSSLRSLLRR